MPQEETIVAPATASGESALAIIRISGPDVPAIAKAVFNLSEDKLIARRATLGGYNSLSGDILDHLVFIYYADGQSFTGECLMELNCHGNPFIVRKVIEDLISRGCRLAEPGEFSRTAFINGKLDLTQAEAIVDMIKARSDRALEAARKQLSGSIGHEINHFVERLLQITAYLEAYIDFPEEDLPAEDSSGPARDLVSLIADMERLISTSKYTTLLKEGVKCVILGEPNAGKSSLLNALTGEERVIVSEEPGTTRDYVEERLHIGPYLIRIVDTAGLHETTNAIEKQGITRSLQQIESADLLIVVLDSTKCPPPLPQSVKDALLKAQTIIVENKIDLAENPDLAQFGQEFPHIKLSAAQKYAIPSLKEKIQEVLESGVIIPDDNTVLISARHADGLSKAKKALEDALHQMRTDQPTEIIASELHLAIESMGTITGKIDNEQMLDELFHSFCIGK